MVMPQFWKDVRKYMFSWIHDPHVEVILVMLIIPFVVNTVMFWVIDNFLMRKTKRFYGSGSTISDTYKQVNTGPKSRSCKVSYRVPVRSDSLESAEGEAVSKSRGASKSNSLRYHKVVSSDHIDSKSGKDSEETMLLLQEEAEIPRGPCINDVLASGNLTFSSLDSDISDDTSNTLIPDGLKRF